MSEKISRERAKQIGRLYGEALAGFEDLGTFQLRLSNMMTYRSYNWDIDQFEDVLSELGEDSMSSAEAFNKRLEDARAESPDGHIEGDMWVEDGKLRVKMGGEIYQYETETEEQTVKVLKRVGVP